ncbi:MULTISPECIES: bacteriocin-like WGxF protein [unclassified Listeria]|nr:MULTISPECIES: bacteriocin-like WGxF protein [unclassified Listeria]
MKIFSITLVNTLLILVTVVIHKVIFRLFLFGYDSLIFYWGIFIIIYFLLNLMTNLVFLNKK